MMGCTTECRHAEACFDGHSPRPDCRKYLRLAVDHGESRSDSAKPSLAAYQVSKTRQVAWSAGDSENIAPGVPGRRGKPEPDRKKRRRKIRITFSNIQQIMV